jgi:DNA polymerase-3 subunit alpha
MPAVAVTDQTNLFCLVRFYKAALGAGIKPIAGTELAVATPMTPSRIGWCCWCRTTGRLQEPDPADLPRLPGGPAPGRAQVQRDWVLAAATG